MTRTPGTLDPRPDLKRDTDHWHIVLDTCQQRPTLFGLLHGLRCGGATLERTTTSDGSPFFRLDYRPVLSVWSEQALVRTWLLPVRSQLTHLFLQAARRRPAPTFTQPSLFTKR